MWRWGRPCRAQSHVERNRSRYSSFERSLQSINLIHQFHLLLRRADFVAKIAFTFEPDRKGPCLRVAALNPFHLGLLPEVQAIGDPKNRAQLADHVLLQRRELAERQVLRTRVGLSMVS